MSGGAVYFEGLLGVMVVVITLAASAIGVGLIAYRKDHVLIELSRKLLHRTNDATRYDGEIDGIARVNLLVLSAFLLCVSVIVCIMGLRIVLA